MKLHYILVLFLLSFGINKANNVSLGVTPLLTEQNIANEQISIRFDLSWDNSWRTNSAPNNWDALWLFAKFKRISDGKWYHASLVSNNVSTGTQGTAATLSVRGDGKGAFYYRSTNSSGTFSSTGVHLRWDYGADGVSCNLGDEISEMRIFAIEMVYVPQGAYYLGSGGTEIDNFRANNTNNPYLVNSEGAINVGYNNGNLYYDSEGNGGDQMGPIPASFPKGYNAFYCMKYEITQEQYADFLNTLTPSQKTARFPNNFNVSRHYIKSVGGIYGCDGNNNNVLNEANDGQNIACNFINWIDASAYADWAGLRPVTELEFEKASRGTATPVANEYAWGTTYINRAAAVSNSRTASESVSSGNCNYWGTNGSNPNDGPIRVGIFATATSNRQTAGASYYGIMELTGNLWEQLISVGNVNGRAFTGINGDGVLATSGNSNTTNWPPASASGTGVRGGDWGLYIYGIIMSDRNFSVDPFLERRYDAGCRCASSL